jgi:PadR family transcriptional regulator PadR
MCQPVKKGAKMTDPIENLISELRRGTLVLTVLSQLDRKQYGYSLSQSLAEQGVEIDQSTLYPLLRRLEKQGMLESEWSVEESRPRRYYALSQTGQETLKTLKQEWFALSDALDQLLRKENRDEDGTL